MVYVSPVNDWLKAKYRRSGQGGGGNRKILDLIQENPFPPQSCASLFYLHQDAILALTLVWRLAVIKHTACSSSL